VHSGLNDDFRLEPLRRMSVFVGAYGSGKSEVSVNFALWLATIGSAAIADLDIINPFYRSADAAGLLEQAGVRLVKPVFANTNVDVPSFGGDVFSLFDGSARHAVLDIGGEDLGARVVSSLRSRFVPEETALYMVVNLFRPFTADAGGIVRAADMLSKAAGLPLSGLVDNTNLLGEEEPGSIVSSLEETRAAARAVGVPLVFRAALDDKTPSEWGNRMPDGTPLLRMRRTVSYSFS